MRGSLQLLGFLEHILFQECPSSHKPPPTYSDVGPARKAQRVGIGRPPVNRVDRSRLPGTIPVYSCGPGISASQQSRSHSKVSSWPNSFGNLLAKERHMSCPAIPLLGVYPTERHAHVRLKDTYENNAKCQRLGTTQMSINRSRHKQGGIHPRNDMLCSNPNQQMATTCGNTDGPHKCNIERKKLGTQEYI